MKQVFITSMIKSIIRKIIITIKNISDIEILLPKGFKKIPKISMGVKIVNTHFGTPGIAKIWVQYVFFPLISVNINIIVAKTKGTAIFPVKFAPPGKTGISPNKLFIHIKKNNVSKNGKNLL